MHVTSDSAPPAPRSLISVRTFCAATLATSYSLIRPLLLGPHIPRCRYLGRLASDVYGLKKSVLVSHTLHLRYAHTY